MFALLFSDPFLKTHRSEVLMRSLELDVSEKLRRMHAYAACNSVEEESAQALKAFKRLSYRR